MENQREKNMENDMETEDEGRLLGLHGDNWRLGVS